MTVEELPKVEMPRISVNDLKAMLDDDEDFILLDLRLDVDVARYRIESPKRQQVSLNSLQDLYTEIPQGKKLVVMDKNGKRAGLGARYLTAKGYDDIIVVSGGINEWIKAGLPTKIAE
ncbi:MAG TPA: rhodanese-like domain-containing protein [Desulfuromonadales bacterium]|nr:rhodanese-like domain-containing protein [Desulfuromonadales bacterium]